MLIAHGPEEKALFRKYQQKRYAGGVVDAVTGMKSGTRITSRKRGVFATKAGDYCFLDLLLGRTRVLLGRHGITPSDPKHPLQSRVVLDMLARLEEGRAEEPKPSFLLMGPAPDPEDPGPVSRRMLEGFRGDRPGVYFFAEGSAAMAIVSGLSADEVHQHVEAMAGSDAETLFVIDTAKVLRGVLAKLRLMGQRLPYEGKP